VAAIILSDEIEGLIMNVKLWSTRIGLLLLLGFTSAFCWFSPANVSASPALQEESPLPPPNDDFAAAEEIGAVRFETTVDTVAATLEEGEPPPSCAVGNGGIINTVWYSFTPPARRIYEVGFDAPAYTALGVYTGSSLADLQEYACTAWNTSAGIVL
jgi:hypothetical protein